MPKSNVLQVRVFAAFLGFAFAEELTIFTAPRHPPLAIGISAMCAVIHVWSTVVLMSIQKR